MFLMTYLQTNILPSTHHTAAFRDTLQMQPNILNLWKLETNGINPLEDKKG